MPATIAAIVPAAGASRRMGQDKRRLPYRKRTVIEVTVGSLCDAGLDPVVVVLEQASPCAELPGLRGARLAINPRPERGMLSSVLSGLDLLDESDTAIDAVAIQPGDHPFVPVEAVRQLASHFADVRPLLLVPRYAKRRGHPLIIAAELFAEMRRCDPEIGLRQLVRRHADALIELPLPYPDADDDLDVPADLQRLQRGEATPAKRVIRFYSVSDAFGAFSNFAAYPIRLKGKTWPTAEHYFQAQKFKGTPQEQTIRKAKTPMIAARMGRDRRAKVRREWDSVRVAVMREAVLAKFSQHEDLRQLLLGTGEAKLVEHTDRDSYWGDGGDGSGRNMLGQILMQIREQLRESS